MGTINPRLAKFYTAVRPEIALPIIITLNQPPEASQQQAVAATGARVRGSSGFINAFYADATQPQAERVAQLAFVVSVQYDEPISALPAPVGGPR